MLSLMNVNPKLSEKKKKKSSDLHQILGKTSSWLVETYFDLPFGVEQ